MDLASTIKGLWGSTRGPATLRYRASRGILGAAVWVLALWVLRTYLIDLPQPMDQAFWPFAWMTAFAIVFWLIVR